jgi:hypothetical protein
LDSVWMHRSKCAFNIFQPCNSIRLHETLIKSQQLEHVWIPQGVPKEALVGDISMAPLFCHLLQQGIDSNQLLESCPAHDWKSLRAGLLLCGTLCLKCQKQQ